MNGERDMERAKRWDHPVNVWFPTFQKKKPFPPGQSLVEAVIGCRKARKTGCALAYGFSIIYTHVSLSHGLLREIPHAPLCSTVVHNPANNVIRYLNEHRTGLVGFPRKPGVRTCHQSVPWVGWNYVPPLRFLQVGVKPMITYGRYYVLLYIHTSSPCRSLATKDLRVETFPALW